MLRRSKYYMAVYFQNFVFFLSMSNKFGLFCCNFIVNALTKLAFHEIKMYSPQYIYNIKLKFDLWLEVLLSDKLNLLKALWRSHPKLRSKQTNKSKKKAFVIHVCVIQNMTWKLYIGSCTLLYLELNSNYKIIHP